MGGMARMAIRVGDIRRSVYKLRIVAQVAMSIVGGLCLFTAVNSG